MPGSRCNTVNSNACGSTEGGLLVCYRCGLDTCRDCSKIVVSRGRKKRFCADCVNEAIRFEDAVYDVGSDKLTAVR